MILEGVTDEAAPAMAGLLWWLSGELNAAAPLTPFKLLGPPPGGP